MALIHLCKHIHSLLRSFLSLRVLFNLQPLKQSMTDTSSSIFLSLWGEYTCAIALCNSVAGTLDRSIVALIHLCKHIPSLLRSLLSLRVLFNLQPLKQSMTDIASIFFAKCAILRLTLSSLFQSTLTYGKYASVGFQSSFLVIHQNIRFCPVKSI